MPCVALIGPELYPIPPIRGGAVELFIDQVAARLGRWRPVVIGPSDRSCRPANSGGEWNIGVFPWAAGGAGSISATVNIFLFTI